MVMYLGNRSSFDFFENIYAMKLAIVHAVLWSIFGGILILYHNRQPPDPSQMNTYDPNDPYR